MKLDWRRALLLPAGVVLLELPLIVRSSAPYAKAHYASHLVHDHTSITRCIETRFGLPAMTARDANALPPLEMFDLKRTRPS